MTPQQMDDVLRFLPRFEEPGRNFVVRPETKRGADGVHEMPYPSYPDDVEEFFRLVGREPWVDFGYEPTKAAEMLRNRAAVERATLDEVRSMLTWCTRAERFCDGAWGAALDDGSVQMLLRRLAVIREEMAG